jgi:hypothetical protein
MDELYPGQPCTNCGAELHLTNPRNIYKSPSGSWTATVTCTACQAANEVLVHRKNQ